MVRKNLKAALFFLALVQSAVLLTMLIERNLKLVRGTEVVLESRMVDPRDLFRGHYTRLHLAISSIKADQVLVTGDIAYDQEIYATLKWGEDEFWIVDTISAARPNGDQPFLKAHALFSSKNESIVNYALRFPFDRYFAEKKDALALEQINRDGKLGIITMVGDTGSGIIKGLIIDGEKIYDEPLF